jgi:prepilin-type N-terminal cleavage/methylation domain-containing protein
MAIKFCRGVTVVELLVVVSVVAVLLAISFPAIQMAREASRRVQCQNNLRQWGFAIHAYEANRGKYPPGYRAQPPVSSFVPFVLPYVEEETLRYDLDASWNSVPNHSAVGHSLATLICPSAPNSQRFEGYGFRAAAGDYTSIHGVSGAFCLLSGWEPFGPSDQNGILTAEPCTAAQVTDGLSQTVLLVEDAGRPLLWRMGKPAAGVAKYGAWAHHEYEIGLTGSDRSWVGSGEGGGTCAINCTNDNEIYSFHAPGANLLFADAGVRLISSNIDTRVLAAMVTRAQGDDARGGE